MSEDPLCPEDGVDDPIRRILAELQRRFRIAGRGTVSRVEKELELGSGYFKDQRRPGRKRFDLKILFRALEALDVEPAEFFASVLGPVDPVSSFKVEAAFLRQRQGLPRIVVLERERPPDEERETVPESDLEELDGLRHEDPALVTRTVRALIGRVADPQVPLLLGIYASASRAAGRCDEAQMVLAHALELAEGRGDHDACGDLLLRAGHVAARRGQTETAHALGERASLIFARSGNLVGLGRSLVDQGNWLGSLDRPHEALRALRAALVYLPAPAAADAEPEPVVQRHRFSCLTSLGLLHRDRGDLEAAGRRLEEAREHSRGIGEGPVGRLLAIQASIERQSGRYPQAEELFREAFEVFRPIDPLDAALCAVELVRVLLQQSKSAEAYDTVKTLLPLLEPLEKNPAASAALAELLRRGLAGPRQEGRGLSPELLGRVVRGLEKGREAAGRFVLQRGSRAA